MLFLELSMNKSLTKPAWRGSYFASMLGLLVCLSLTGIIFVHHAEASSSHSLKLVTKMSRGIIVRRQLNERMI